MTDQPDISPPDESGSHSIVDRILRASVLVFSAHILLKIISLVQFRLIGQFCDPVTRDLFVFGFEGVLMTLFLVGEEALGPAFLPVFMEARDKKNEETAWGFANTVLSLQFVLLLIVAGLVACFPMLLVTSLTDWDRPDANPAYMALAPVYARYMVLGLVGLSLGSTTYMILNGYKRFFLAAFGDAAVKIGIVGALIVAYALNVKMAGHDAAVVFVAGAVIGSFLKLGTHLAGLRREIGRLRFRAVVNSPSFRCFLALMLPLIFGIVFAKVRDIYNHIYVLTHVEPGLLSANAWGRKLYQTIGYMVPYAVSIAMLPFFCEMVDRDAKDELGKTLTRSGRLIFMMFAPVAALVVVLSLPLAQMLYQGGKFGYHECQQAAVANMCYSLVLPFYALEYVLMQAFFSNRKMVAITVIGMFFSALSMAISYVCVVRIGLTGTSALAAVALSFTVSRILKVIALVVRARSFLPCFPLGETASFLVRITTVSLAAGGAAWIVRSFYESEVLVSEAERTRDILVWVGLDLLLAGAAGGMVTLAMLWILCRDDLLLVRDWTLRKLARRRSEKS